MDDGSGYERQRLLEEIRKADAELAELTPEASHLREEYAAMHEIFLHRTEELEAKLLACHLVATEAQPKPPQPHTVMVHAPKLHHQAREAEKIPFWDPTVPPGGVVVDIRYHGELPADLWAASVRDGRKGKAVEEVISQPPVEMGTGPIYDSNALLRPSPHHQVGPWQEKGYMQNVFPITRPPAEACGVDLLEVHRAEFVPGHSIAGKPRVVPREAVYSVPVDYFEARRYPGLTPVRHHVHKMHHDVHMVPSLMRA